MIKHRLYGAILLCLALLLVFSGCGVAAGPADTAGASAAEVVEPTPVATAEPTAAPTPEPLSGAEVFREYYSRKMAREVEIDHSHTDLTLLEGMVSSTVGTVVEDERLAIEVLGAVFSGSAGEVLLRVTAKELDSVLNDDERKYFSNYQFEWTSPVYGSTTGKRFENMGYRYIYSDTAPDLAPNQLVIHLSFTFTEPFYNGSLLLPLGDFGRFKKGTGRMEPLYEDVWLVHVLADAAEDDSRRWTVDEPIQLGDYRFSVDDIYLTALSCTVNLSGLEEESYLAEHQQEINDAFFTGRDGVGIAFADGSFLAIDPLRVSAGACENEFSLDFNFSGPVAVEDMVSLHAFGKEFPVVPAVEETPVEEDAATAFLRALYTSDHQERYRLFLVADQFRDDLTPEELNAAYVEHSSCIRPYVTEELFDKMLRNRELMRWDQSACALGVAMTPVGIELAEVEGKPLNYDFTVTVQLEGEHNNIASVTGRLVMADEDTIQSFTISEYKDFPEMG